MSSSFAEAVSVEAMAARLRSLSITRRRTLMERFGVDVRRDSPLTVTQRFLLTAAVYCHRLVPDPEGSAAVVDHYWADLSAAGDELAAAPPGLVPAIRLAVLDSRYATASGTAGFFDVLTGRRVDRLPLAPIETITVDLTAAFFRAEGVSRG